MSGGGGRGKTGPNGTGPNGTGQGETGRGGTGPDETGEIARKAQRLQRARLRRRESPWRGLGMFGMVGWAVAVPVVAGVALGVWIDARWPGERSWTLMLLLAGAALGCLNAWYWIQREGRRDD
jgi:ATP synthase protein I